MLFGTERACKVDRKTVGTVGGCYPAFSVSESHCFPVVHCVRCKGFPGTPNEPGS